MSKKQAKEIKMFSLQKKFQVAGLIMPWFIFALAVTTALILHYPLMIPILIIWVIGAVVCDTFHPLVFVEPRSIKLWARPIARKYFRRAFKIDPPRKRDWLAMKACQKIVDRKLIDLKANRETLYEKECRRLSEDVSPENVQRYILERRELHAQVESAKSDCLNAEYLAKFFHFNT
jgi:hypothetical protein